MIIDTLILTAELEGEENSYLLVMRKKGEGFYAVKEFEGKEAEDIYKKLTGEEKNADFAN